MRKAPTGKAPLHLTPWRGLRAVVAALEHGDIKYSPGSWREHASNPDWKSMYGGAILRHMASWLDPDEPDVDPESGISHLAHAGAGVLIALWLSGADYTPSKLLSRPAVEPDPGDSGHVAGRMTTG